jgi:hypothetical protein
MARKYDGKLEPESDDTASVEREALISIAISLKRIADVLQGDPTNRGIVEHLFAVLDDASHNHAQRMR